MVKIKTLPITPGAESEAKKPKTATSMASGTVDASGVDIFNNNDIIPVVFQFLNPRELYRLATCCRKILHSKQLSHKVVIRSAMLATGGKKISKSKDILERLVSCIKQHTIWIPSPLRLLRLVNGRKCEKCKTNVNVIPPTFGVYLCRSCVTRCTNIVQHNSKWASVVTHPNVASERMDRQGYYSRSPGRSRLFRAVETDGHEPIGPLFTIDQFQQQRKRNRKISVGEFVAATTGDSDKYEKTRSEVLKQYKIAIEISKG